MVHQRFDSVQEKRRSTLYNVTFLREYLRDTTTQINLFITTSIYRNAFPI